MPNSLTSSGLTTATQAELLAFFTAAFKSIYGVDINLESDTPDGQWMNIIIQAILDVQDLNTQIYNSFDPDNAIGNVLDQRVAINGIQRQAGTYTTTNLTIVTSQSVNLYGLDQDVQPVFTAADGAGNQWQLTATQLGVVAGTNVFLFRAANAGQVLTVPNTITIPVTIVLGVTSINNPTTYVTLGINEESDAQLKIRRLQSVSLQSQGYFQGLLAALENINGITSAFVYENDTGTTDIDGVPGHSIWVIVAGTPNVALAVAYNVGTTYAYGSIASSAGINYISVANGNIGNSVSNPLFWQVYNPVAEAIYNYRNAGCGMFNSLDAGSQSYVITQINGTSFTVYWDTVIATNLFTKFVASSLNGVNPPNIAAILSYLTINFVPGVNEEVNVNALATLVQQADPNTLVTGAGFAPILVTTYFNTLSPSAKNKQFVVNPLNIVITPMILTCPGGIQQITAGLVTDTTVSVASGGSTIQFATLGGYQGAALNYTIVGSGSIGLLTGLYTSNAAVTDLITVTDTIGNTATATITVI